MIKAIVFDADHTLYVPVSENAYEKKFAYLSKETGIHEEEIRAVWENEVERVIGERNPRFRKRDAVLENTLLELEFGEEERERIIKDALKVFWNRVAEDLKVAPGTSEMLDRLQEYYRILGVASEEFRENLETKLSAALGDWEDYFDFVVTPEDAAFMKPSTNYYSHILSKTRFKPEQVLVVGDSWKKDLKPAQELGMKTCLVAPEKEGDPDAHITDVTKLEDVLPDLHER